MSHDATKCLMGVPMRSGFEANEFDADPASFPAGTAVRLKSDGTISVTKSDGSWLGISAGRSLSNTKKLSVIRAGEKVPMRVSRQPARGSVTISSYANLLTGGADTITVAGVGFVAQSGAATLGQATVQAATSNAATAASLVAQVNAHATSSALVVASLDPADATKVIITAKSNLVAGDTIGLSYTEGGTGTGASVSGATLDDSDDSADWLVLGAKAYIADDTGMVDDPNGGATISDAIIASALLDGIDEDGNTVAAVLVDIPGGL